MRYNNDIQQAHRQQYNLVAGDRVCWTDKSAAAVRDNCVFVLMCTAMNQVFMLDFVFFAVSFANVMQFCTCHYHISAAIHTFSGRWPAIV